LWITLFALSVVCVFGTGCLDASGSSVDWFAAIKSLDGYAYWYTTDSSWQVGGSLQAPNPTGPLGKTLLSVWNSRSSSVGYFLYNDESNGSQHEDYAHAKGLAMFDSTGGFWLVHSVPEFPGSLSSGYEYPVAESRYGQSFLCLSLSASTIDTVAELLQTDHVFVYDSSLPSTLKSRYPEVAALLAGSHPSGSATNSTDISTVSGSKFTAFAKSSAWGQDLYESLVQPHFSADMAWETWADGTGDLPSFCKPHYTYDSENVQTVRMLSTTNWTRTQDHSKWGVSLPGGTTIACVGDINRQQSQYSRGGGTVCADDAGLYKAFASILSSEESC